MIDSSQFDVRELENLALPYDVTTKELDPKPRLVDGLNMYVTTGGKLQRRPAVVKLAGITPPGVANQYRIERLLLNRTTGGSLYNVCVSAKDLTAPSPQYRFQYWTQPFGPWGATTVPYNSSDPHESVSVNGRVYTRVRPESLYSLDSNAMQLYPSGGVMAQANWGLWIVNMVPAFPGGTAPSAGAVTVRVGWKYAYAFETPTGHVGNRSPYFDTGPFTNLSRGVSINPEPVSTAQAPYIRIYRTTDGGGLFSEIARVENPGVTFTWWDGSATPSEGTPVLDSALDLSLSNLAPDVSLNHGPPARNAPSFYPDPTQQYSNVAYFARRIWYAIENRLYFSGQEEIYSGHAEEAFPDPYGIRGNWYILPDDVVSLVAAQDRLFVITTSDVFVVRGEDRLNLRLTLYASRTGMLPGFKVASCAYADTVFFMTNDWQVRAISGENPPTLLSRDIASQLRTLGITTSDVQMAVWSSESVSWLVVAMINHTDQSLTRVFVYDLARGFWFVPWAIKVTALTTGQISSTDPIDRLWMAVTGENGLPYIAYLDLGAVADVLDAVRQYTCTVTTSLFDLPAGNHVNLLRQPGHHPMLSYLRLERKTTAVTPTVEYRLDEFAGAWTTGTPVSPPFLTQRTSYKTLWYPIQVVAQRVQMKISYAANNDYDDVQTIGFVFTPEAGA